MRTTDINNTIANPLLWFLQHSMWDISRTPIINRTTWEAWGNGYIEVNRLFAEAITPPSKDPSRKHTIVMLQDYHLYLVPAHAAPASPSSRTAGDLHLHAYPWPGPEYCAFSRLPCAKAFWQDLQGQIYWASKRGGTD
jgi:trehalose 6-phosphate synthase